MGPIKVNAATGNAMFTWSQRPVATLGGAAAVSMTYNSLLSAGTSVVEATPGLPPGWMASWGNLPVTRLELIPGGSAVVRLADGGKEAFKWNVNRWETVETYQQSLLRTIPGSPVSYQWESPSGWLINFGDKGQILDALNQGDDVSPTSLGFEWGTTTNEDDEDIAVLREVIDPVIAAKGRTMTLSYGGDSACPVADIPAGVVTAPAGLLCKISHMDGSETVFWYVTSGGSSQVAKIVDDGNGNLGTGVDDQAAWDLGWDSNFRIVSLRDPQTNRLTAAGEWPVDGSGNLLSPEDHSTLLGYDSAGRVASITGGEPDATHVRPGVAFGYPSDTVTTATDVNRVEPNGYTTRWTTDARGRQVKVEDRMGRAGFTRWVDADTDRVSWTDTESLNAAGAQVFMRTGSVYDDRGRVIESWGPTDRTEFGASSESTGTATGGTNTPKTAVVYDGGLSGLASTFWANAHQEGRSKAHGFMSSSSLVTTGEPHDLLSSTDDWSIRLTGSIKFPAAGTYTVKAVGYGPTRFALWDSWADLWTSTDPGGTGTISPAITVAVSAGDVGKWKSVVIDNADSSGTGGVDLQWIPPGGTQVQVPVANLRPEFGLATESTVRVDTTNTVVSTTSYDDPVTTGVNESYLGIPRVVTSDPGGLALQTVETFEESSSTSTGFLRRLSRQLPSGGGSKVTYEYYDSDSDPISSGATACGVGSLTDQLGMLERTIQADPDGGGPESSLVREYVYDSAGRQAGYRASTEVENEPWTCTTFDDAGRVATVEFPAWDIEPARTVVYDYMVGGDPKVMSVSDSVGTVTTTTDWAGRTVAYTDVWGLVTSTSYDDLGRVATSSNSGGTVAYAYGGDDQVTETKFNGDVVANPTYDSLSRMTGVSYPAGVGKAGNGTSGSFGFDDKGRAASMAWSDPASGLITSDAVTSRDLVNRVLNQSVDGFDPNGSTPNYGYDKAGRLVSAVGFAEAPAVGAATRTTAYDFTSSSCGLASNAGRNGNRVSKTVNSTSVTYCYDHADRLTATSDLAAAAVNTGDGTLSYDSHGNTSVLATEQHVYDIADRHVATVPTTPGPVQGTDALLMVANPGGLTAMDLWVKTRLEATGWTVTLADDNTITLAQADAADLVVISASISSSKSAVVTATTTGVVSASVGGWDELKMVNGQNLVTGSTSVDVVDGAHPAAVGVTEGNVVTSTSGASHSWGLVAPDAQIVATIAGDFLKPAVFAYGLGDRLVDDSKAPGRRITWTQFSATTTDLNANSDAFFDGVVAWAAQPVTAAASLGKDVLLMVGDSTAPSLNDDWMYNRLENAGWTVTVVDEDVITVAQADAADLVVVSASTLTASSSKVKATTTPVLSNESWGWPLLGMATTGGAEAGQKTVTITDTTNPLSAGLANGAHTTSVDGHSHAWGTVASTADVAATLAGDASKATIFSYDTGEVLTDSTTAAGPRVG
ncbi:MAG: hypothetical protein WBA45_12285, partial [Microthrixaceae bacterium]